MKLIKTSTSAGREYVGDIIEGPPPPRDLHDLPLAADMLTQYCHRRLDALLPSTRQTQAVVLLSGGVDSLSLLAALSQHTDVSNIVSITVIAKETRNIDLPPAQEAARIFGVKHRVVVVDTQALSAFALNVAERLESTELWEVAAAITVLAAYEEMEALGLRDAPILTGGGADVLLAGGRTPPERNTAEQDDWLTETIFANVKSSFIRERLIPDFYERLLGPLSDSYVEFYQTIDAWNTTNRFGYPSLFTRRGSSGFDKACLRLAATTWGLPESLAWGKKSPMQVSSGIVSGLAQITREKVRRFPDARHYSDPRDEPAEHVLARIAIQELGSGLPTAFSEGINHE